MSQPIDAMLDLLHQWSPDEGTWQRILVANQASLYES